MRMGSGGGTSSSIASSPRAKASAAAKVAATLSSGDAASRQARAAADSDAVTSWPLWERLQPRALSWPLPLRRQGEAGRGCPRFELIPKAPLPNPPLPSQGREQSSRLKTLLQEQSAESRRQKTQLPLRPVRAQLLDAFDVARLDA